ncbi:Megalin [Carabus blaptoides fortunei]
MRGGSWPNGSLRQAHLHGDVAPRAIDTISGVLHVRETIFGHKWVYKLNESRRGAGLEFKSDGGNGLLVGIVTVATVFIVVVFALGFTILGPKYLNHSLTKYRNQGNWTQNTENELKIIFNLSRNNNSNILTDHSDKNSTDTGQKPLVFLETNVQNTNGCSNCDKSQICLQITTKQFPECLPAKDITDPTGCGGHCKLEIQFCKQIDTELNIYSCMDTPTLMCGANEWKCNRTLMCIPANYRCDGIIHCFDQSDEMQCDCNLNTHFQCGHNISCFPNVKKCDGAVDCWDAFDEKSCTTECGTDNVSCYNGECISKERFCDGNFDCQDKSDEPHGCKDVINKKKDSI